MHLPDAPPPAKPWDPPPGDEGKLPADELRHDLQRFQAPAAAAAAAAAPAPEDDDDDGKKRDDGGDDGDGKKRDGDGDDDDDGDATGPRHEARRAQAVVDAAGGVAAASTEAPPPIAQHCSSRHGGVEEACRGPTVPNLKQRRNARLLAGLLDVAAPDVDAMSHDEAERWLHDAWRKWMARK